MPGWRFRYSCRALWRQRVPPRQIKPWRLRRKILVDPSPVAEAQAAIAIVAEILAPYREPPRKLTRAEIMAAPSGMEAAAETWRTKP